MADSTYLTYPVFHPVVLARIMQCQRSWGVSVQLRQPICRFRLYGFRPALFECGRALPVQLTEPKLLIADDDRDFRESLGEVFSRRGYETRLAADGCEAVEIVQKASGLHLVVLDVHMPRLSGIQALGQIRQLAARALPCILMSAQLDDMIVQQAEALNTASVLSKPFTLRDITSTVETILRDCYGYGAEL